MQAGTGRGPSCVKIAGHGYKFRPACNSGSDNTYVCYIGRVTLVKRKIVIDCYSGRCAYCRDDTCLHVLALQECLENDVVVPCEASKYEEIIYCPLDMKSIILLKNETYDLFYCENQDWICKTCLTNCRMQATVHKIILSDSQWNNAAKRLYNSIEYSTISFQPIPITLDEQLVSVYTQQLSDGIQLPPLIYPEIENFHLGHPFSRVLEKIGVIVYTENEVLNLKVHKGTFLVTIY